MRVLAIFVFLIGIVLAGGGAYYGYQLIGDYEQRLANNDAGRTAETTRIVAARIDIPFGKVLDRTDLAWLDWPSDSVPEGVFTEARVLFGTTEEGTDQQRSALQSIVAGEVILESKVSGFNERPRMSFKLSKGKRAFSFPINATTGVAGFVQAGDRVDILLTRADRLNQGRTETTVFMQDVLVIAVDQQTNLESRAARVGNIATVEVDPIDAQRLTVAKSEGQLSMTLRGIDEEVMPDEEMTPVTTTDLFGSAPVVEEIKPVIEKQRTIRMRRGGQVEDIAVD